MENSSRAAAVRFLIPGRRNVSSFLDIRPDFWHKRNLYRLFISQAHRQTDRQTDGRAGEKPLWHCFLFFLFCSNYTNCPGWLEKLIHMVETSPLKKHKKATKKATKITQNTKKTCNYSIYLIWRLLTIVKWENNKETKQLNVTVLVIN